MHILIPGLKIAATALLFATAWSARGAPLESADGAMAIAIALVLALLDTLKAPR